MSEKKRLFFAQPTPLLIAARNECTTPMRLLFTVPSTTTPLVVPGTVVPVVQCAFSAPLYGQVTSPVTCTKDGADSFKATQPSDIAASLTYWQLRVKIRYKN